MRSTRLAAILAAGLAFPAMAASPEPVQQHNSRAVWFENWQGLSNALLRVVAPDGTVTDVQAASGTPVFQLDPGQAADGVYRYELRAATEETRKIVNPMDNGRGDAAKDSLQVPYYTTGRFVVANGVIITPEDVREEG